MTEYFGSTNINQTILIIEDSDDDFGVIERALNRSNDLKNPLYRCEHGQDAIDYLLQKGRYSKSRATRRPGLIILDLNMPGMDGRQFLAKVKAIDSVKKIPVLIMTTSDREEDIDYCYEMGANAYIKKPFDWPGFCEAIQRTKDYWFETAILPHA